MRTRTSRTGPRRERIAAPHAAAAVVPVVNPLLNTRPLDVSTPRLDEARALNPGSRQALTHSAGYTNPVTGSVMVVPSESGRVLLGMDGDDLVYRRDCNGCPSPGPLGADRRYIGPAEFFLRFCGIYETHGSPDDKCGPDTLFPDEAAENKEG